MKTQLRFTDTKTLSEFILQYEPSKAEVNSISCSLTADLDEQQIAIACSGFDALLQKPLFEVQEASPVPDAFLTAASHGDCTENYNFS